MISELLPRIVSKMLYYFCQECLIDNFYIKMTDISQLKETLEQIQATQKALVDKVDMLVSSQVLKQSISDESLKDDIETIAETVAEEPCETDVETSAETVQEEQHEEVAKTVANAVAEEVAEEPCKTVQEEQHKMIADTMPETVAEESCEESHKTVSETVVGTVSEEPSQESSQEPSQEPSNESSNESSQDIVDVDPLARIEEIPEETRKKTSEVNKYDLGDGLHYYEEDGICYIDVDKDDEIIDQVRAKIVSASLIRDYIKNGDFEKIKPYVPEDAYEALYKEYYRWERAQGHLMTEEEKRIVAEQEKQVEQKTAELNEVLKQLAGKIPGWKRRQLIPRRDTLRREINNYRGYIDKLRHGEC